MTLLEFIRDQLGFVGVLLLLLMGCGVGMIIWCMTMVFREWYQSMEKSMEEWSLSIECRRKELNNRRAALQKRKGPSG